MSRLSCDPRTRISGQNICAPHKLPPHWLGHWTSLIQISCSTRTFRAHLFNLQHQRLACCKTTVRSAAARSIQHLGRADSAMEALPTLQRCFTLSRPTRCALSPSTSTFRAIRPTLSLSSRRRSFTTSSCFSEEQPPKSSPPPPNSNSIWRNLVSEMRTLPPKDGQSGSRSMQALRGQRSRSPSQAQILESVNATVMGRPVDQNKMEEELRGGSGSSVALRLKPTLGRTVDNVFGEPARGFRTLERKCAENRVRADARTQEKHVRKGQRRKDIRALRWRKLFKEGFIAECDRVRRMRKQGW